MLTLAEIQKIHQFFFDTKARYLMQDPQLITAKFGTDAAATTRAYDKKLLTDHYTHQKRMDIETASVQLQTLGMVEFGKTQAEKDKLKSELEATIKTLSLQDPKDPNVLITLAMQRNALDGKPAARIAYAAAYNAIQAQHFVGSTKEEQDCIDCIRDYYSDRKEQLKNDTALLEQFTKNPYGFERGLHPDHIALLQKLGIKADFKDHKEAVEVHAVAANAAAANPAMPHLTIFQLDNIGNTLYDPAMLGLIDDLVIITENFPEMSTSEVYSNYYRRMTYPITVTVSAARTSRFYSASTLKGLFDTIKSDKERIMVLPNECDKLSMELATLHYKYVAEFNIRVPLGVRDTAAAEQEALLGLAAFDQKRKEEYRTMISRLETLGMELFNLRTRVNRASEIQDRVKDPLTPSILLDKNMKQVDGSMVASILCAAAYKTLKEKAKDIADHASKINDKAVKDSFLACNNAFLEYYKGDAKKLAEDTARLEKFMANNNHPDLKLPKEHIVLINDLFNKKPQTKEQIAAQAKAAKEANERNVKQRVEANNNNHFPAGPVGGAAAAVLIGAIGAASPPNWMRDFFGAAPVLLPQRSAAEIAAENARNEAAARQLAAQYDAEDQAAAARNQAAAPAGGAAAAGGPIGFNIGNGGAFVAFAQPIAPPAAPVNNNVQPNIAPAAAPVNPPAQPVQPAPVVVVVPQPAPVAAPVEAPAPRTRSRRG